MQILLLLLFFLLYYKPICVCVCVGDFNAFGCSHCVCNCKSFYFVSAFERLHGNGTEEDVFIYSSQTIQCWKNGSRGYPNMTADGYQPNCLNATLTQVKASSWRPTPKRCGTFRLRLASVQKPTLDEYFARPLFLWLPKRVLKCIVRCPNCTCNPKPELDLAGIYQGVYFFSSINNDIMHIVYIKNTRYDWHIYTQRFDGRMVLLLDFKSVALSGLFFKSWEY